MIKYNLYQYLITKFSSLNFCIGGFKIDSPVSVSALMESGGDPEKKTGQKRYRFQILTRADSDFEANKNSEAIYQQLQNQYQLTLPEYDDGEDIFPAVEVGEINPIQTPYGIGQDDDGRFLYTANYYVLLEVS
jgi:hypothetical protein